MEPGSYTLRPTRWLTGSDAVARRPISNKKKLYIEASDPAPAPATQGEEVQDSEADSGSNETFRAQTASPSPATTRPLRQPT
jgi:hypothetical protein